MSDRQKASSPTAPIAWMSQAYDTTGPTASSPVIEQKSARLVNSPTIEQKSARLVISPTRASTLLNNANNSTVTSLER
jgi:hypothetical protein